MGFIFDGISSNDMKLKARLTSWQVISDIQNNTQKISGKVGVADYGCSGKERIIKVSCNIYPQKNFNSLVHVLDDISEWLNPEKGVKRLIFDDVPDRYFEARIYSQVDCERVLRAAGAFELTFICPDPFSYSTYEETYEITSVGASTIFRCFGNTESYPKYHLSGVIPEEENTYIDVSTNSSILRIHGPLSEGETLVVDTALMIAKVVNNEGETLRNGLPLLESIQFPVLSKWENEVSIRCSEGVTFNKLYIEAKSRWR